MRKYYGIEYKTTKSTRSKFLIKFSMSRVIFIQNIEVQHRNKTEIYLFIYFFLLKKQKIFFEKSILKLSSHFEIVNFIVCFKLFNFSKKFYIFKKLKKAKTFSDKENIRTFLMNILKI